MRCFLARVRVAGVHVVDLLFFIPFETSWLLKDLEQ